MKFKVIIIVKPLNEFCKTRKRIFKKMGRKFDEILRILRKNF